MAVEGAIKATQGGGTASKFEIELRRVQGTTNHFATLGLDVKYAEPSEVKRAFRKVVLLVHPDKNHLEGSAAAFQKASEAFETLLEPARQRYYLRNLPRRFVTTTHRKRKRKHSDDDDNDDHTTASGHGGASGPSRQKPRLRRSDPKKRQSVDEFVRAVFADMRRQEEARANRSKAKQDGRRAQAEAVKRAAEARVLAEGGMERVEATARSWGMWKTATRSRVRVKGVVKRPRRRYVQNNVAPVVTERGSAPPTTTGDSVVVVCTLCRRKFRSVAGLSRHKALSKLHAAQVQAAAAAAALAT